MEIKFFQIYSTVSSGINSMATVSIVDVVQPIWRKFRPLSPPSHSLIGWMSKVIGLAFGVATIGTSLFTRLLNAKLKTVTKYEYMSSSLSSILARILQYTVTDTVTCIIVGRKVYCLIT